MSTGAGAAAVRRFVEAFNAEELDALVEVLDPEVEIQASRGIVLGHQEARRWATRNPAGHLQQRLVLDELRDEGTHVIATMRRQWQWRESGEIGDEQELTCVATIREGRIARWQPFADPGEALAAAGLED